MTDESNVPAVRQEQPRADLAPVTAQDTDSWVNVMRPILALAEKVYDTEFVPRGLRGSEAATAAAMLYGREVGLPPMTALNVTHVVEGKPGLSAEAMRALVFAAGHEIEFVETTGAVCTMRARRAGSERWTELTWTIDMARAAGVTGKNNWKSYPRAMLQARCTTELCRMVFPDVIHGFRSLEELEDMAETGGTAESGAPSSSGSTTRVSRKRATKKASAAPKAAQPAAQTTEPTGPPLPGEPGYDDPRAAAAPAPKHAAEAPRSEGSEATSAGGPEDGPAASEGEASEVGSTSESPAADVVDAELVEDEPSGNAVAGPETPGETAGEGDVEPSSPSRAQMRMLMASLNERGIDPNDREERLLVASKILGTDVESYEQLNAAQVSTLIDTLARTRDRAGLWALLDELDARGGAS